MTKYSDDEKTAILRESAEHIERIEKMQREPRHDEQPTNVVGLSDLDWSQRQLRYRQEAETEAPAPAERALTDSEVRAWAQQLRAEFKAMIDERVQAEREAERDFIFEVVGEALGDFGENLKSDFRMVLSERM